MTVAPIHCIIPFQRKYLYVLANSIDSNIGSLMHPVFSVTSEEIQNLTDVQARELVARLCKSELRVKDISSAAVSWGGDQRAKDGGVDVRVDVSPPRGIGGYVKKDRCAFQVKAETFGASKIPGEMAPKGALRPAILDLAASGGAYVIASTRDNLSDSSLADRKAAMEKCLARFSLAGKVEIDFFDCRRIADWVEQHPAMAIWVKSASGKPLVGWKPYGPWAYQEHDADAEYLIDDRVKIFVPEADEGIDVSSAIRRLRTDLSRSVSVRLVGLSGVGKTRLVQALFDKRICTDQPALDPENVIYADLSDTVAPQPVMMVESLVESAADCVVVVDNCGPDVHQRLTEIAKRPGSKIRLITVEYDIRDDLPEGTVCYRLEGSSDEIIKSLLKRRFNLLSENDVDKIAEFSDGNARVAYALASTSEAKGELARLRDSELFHRLFHQKNVESSELLICAETASLLYSFDGQNASDGSEISILAGLAEVSEVAFLRNVIQLQRRGLVQQRGKWRAVLPHAISNRLAANAVEMYQPERLKRLLIDNASGRVARSFSRRLGYLHISRRAAEMVSSWLKPDGLLGDLTTLNDLGRAIFSNVAPVSEEAALAALERAVTDSDFTSTDNLSRREFARVARSIAYDPRFFDRAVQVLVRFALAEPVHYNYEPARDVLRSLFFCRLSGTEAKSAQRSQVVRTLLFSTDERERKLGFVLLDAALEAWHFTSLHGFEFGARRRGFGWWPRTQDDVREWYTPFLSIAVELGGTNTNQGREARSVLGESVRGLWVRARLTDEIVRVAEVLKAIDGWPDGWLGTRRILQWDKDALSGESLTQLRTLEIELRPRDLRAQIGARVLARGSFTDDIDPIETEEGERAGAASRFRTSEKVAENLGKSAAHEESLLLEILPDLLRHSSNSKVWNFGFGIGQESGDVVGLMEKARALIVDALSGSLSLIFIRGVLSGWHKANPMQVASFLDRALYDEVWGKWFPELQLCVQLDTSGYERLSKSLELGTSPIWQYQYLGMGRATDPLSIGQISNLVVGISKKLNGLAVAFDVLSMVIHCAAEKDDLYRSKLGRFSVEFLRNLDWSNFPTDNDSLDHDLNVILEFALGAPEAEADKLDILRNLIAFERSSPRSYSYKRGQLLAPFFKYYPRATLDAIYVPDDDGAFRTAMRVVSETNIDREETAVWRVPADALIEWCETSPTDRFVFAAETCRLFEKSSEDSESQTIADVAVRILAAADDKGRVLNIFISRFRPKSWSGPLSAVLRERLPLLGKLNSTGDSAMQGKIDEAQKEFSDWISKEEKREENEERARSESFE
ncbi:hypothetical protein IVA98_26050 [Bradyrhizobium sp. 160]|uniref:hypothetical protein n=1 Tax=Bradyrhizobium sp. 160 TaxID=2782634 RepID=UPI001FF99F53|nr:hypothetical protein [Bradyrhizobium sp. 160]MCK1626560.1 hypothetical protein [Bradyrhizobium sp. 160]